MKCDRPTFDPCAASGGQQDLHIDQGVGPGCPSQGVQRCFPVYVDAIVFIGTGPSSPHAILSRYAFAQSGQVLMGYGFSCDHRISATGVMFAAAYRN